MLTFPRKKTEVVPPFTGKPISAPRTVKAADSDSGDDEQKHVRGGQNEGRRKRVK
jgi:hypothetical protein